jgi:PKD repeat protein
LTSKALVRTGALGVALLLPAGAQAQGVAIEHAEIGCIVAGKFPKMNACFSPASRVGKARVYFRPETLSTWYYVEMAADAPCHAGVLLKPSKSLIEKKIFYYIDVQGDGTGRTPEYAPVVVRSEAECKTRVAPLSATGPAAVFPAIPPGFVGGGISTGVIAGGVAAAAVVGGGVVALKNDDDEPAPPTTPTTVPVTTPSTPPPVTPPPTAPPPGAALVAACQASPRSGDAPLRVDFRTFPNGGTGTYTFEWTFGDGGESTNPNPAHTFLTAGVFNSTVVVRSGSQTVSCSRPITVTTPPTPPPAPAKFTLAFTSIDDAQDCNGAPSVTIDPGNVVCTATPNAGTTCSPTFAAGTSVTITSSTNCGAQVCWSGACSGAPSPVGSSCTLTLTADAVAEARFVFGPCFPSAAKAPPTSLSWNVELDSAGAVGHAVVGGQVLVAASGRRVEARTPRRQGESVVTATLVEAVGKAGTWRFEAAAGESLEPGSLRVLRGDVVLLTPTSIVFRVKGVVGEQLAFSYRVRR